MGRRGFRNCLLGAALGLEGSRGWEKGVLPLAFAAPFPAEFGRLGFRWGVRGRGSALGGGSVALLASGSWRAPARGLPEGEEGEGRAWEEQLVAAGSTRETPRRLLGRSAQLRLGLPVQMVRDLDVFCVILKVANGF